MCEIIQLFGSKLGDKQSEKVKKLSEITNQDSTEELVAYWEERNNRISDEFHTRSIFDKQTILDTILDMNLELYKLVVKLKKGEEV